MTLKLKSRYTELLTGINLLQGFNTDITVLVKVTGEEKALSLGVFNIDSNSFNRDGEFVLTLKSNMDSVNLANIGRATEENSVIVRYMAVLELPDNE